MSASCFSESSFPPERFLQANLFRAELDEYLIQPRVVIHILDPLLARDLVQRRLGNIDKAILHQRRHLPVKKRQQQRPDVRSVHVGIGHDDDFVVAELFDVNAPSPSPSPIPVPTAVIMVRISLF